MKDDSASDSLLNPTLHTKHPLSALVIVTAKAFYMPHHSQPSLGRYVFGYFININNTSEEPLQLMDRHWIITDALDRTQDVNGLGIIGNQPIIEAGERFSYSSVATLSTSHGFMQGSYGFRSMLGESLRVDIPLFNLENQPDPINFEL